MQKSFLPVDHTEMDPFPIFKSWVGVVLFFFFSSQAFSFIRSAKKKKDTLIRQYLQVSLSYVPEPFSMMKVSWVSMFRPSFFCTHSDNMNHSDLNSSVNGALQ